MIIIEGIGALCCAIVMGVAILLGMNYLETNIWWFYFLEPLLIVITMGGALLCVKRSWVNYLAIALFIVTTLATGRLTKQACDYGEQITEQRAINSNNSTINMWNQYAPEAMKVELTTEASYLDRVGVAGILILQKYGRDLHVGYWGINIILYALLFPGIALLFAILWRKKKELWINYGIVVVCSGTLAMSFYLFQTLPMNI